MDYCGSCPNLSKVWVELKHVRRDIYIALCRLTQSIYTMIDVHYAHVAAAFGPECIIWMVEKGIWIVGIIPLLIQEVVQRLSNAIYAVKVMEYIQDY